MKYEPIIKSIVRQKKNILGIRGEIKSIRISKLGMGEVNFNSLVAVNAKHKFVFRVRYQYQNDASIKREFKSLKIIPHGFGPKPILFDNTKKVLPRAYSILSFIEGKIVRKWSEEHLIMHADKIARLHARRYNYCGTIDKKKRILDLQDLLAEEIGEYSEDAPWLLQDKDVNKILPLMKAYIEQHNHLFTSMRSFSLLHGDPCIDNIIFTKHGVEYIDWEQMRFGDPADDLSKLFDPVIAMRPWSMNLSGEKLELFLSTYLNHRKDPDLRQRLKIWQVYTLFTSMLFFKWKIKNYHKSANALSKKHYQKSLVNVTRELAKRLKRHETRLI